MPTASQTESRPKPKAAPAQPRPQPPAQPPPQRPDISREFGGRDQRQPLRGPIPMRPDMVPGDKAPPAGSPATAAPSPSPSPSPSRTPSPANPPEQPTASSGDQPVDPASLPRPPLPKKIRRKGGRMRLSSTETSGPVVKKVRRLDQVSAEEAAAKTETPAEQPPPRAQLPPMGDSLDDLFGMAAMGGRMTLGSAKKKAPAEGGGGGEGEGEGEGED